jgi:hypothetical protein
VLADLIPGAWVRDLALIGEDCGDAAPLHPKPHDRAVLDDSHAVLPGAARERLSDVGGVGLTVGRQVRGADHVRAMGDFQVFADGFAGPRKEPGLAVHRPSGLAVGPDGALFVTDDQRGTVWRVTYKQ